MQQKPSFGESVVSGIVGSVKGALTGGMVGAAGGALVGSLIAGASMLLAPATGGLSAALLMLGATAGSWAAGGALLAGAIGSVAGMVTGVVKSRETDQPTAQDIVNVAKVSFAQGVQVGATIEHSKHRHSHREIEDMRRAKNVMAEHHSLQ